MHDAIILIYFYLENCVGVCVCVYVCIGGSKNIVQMKFVYHRNYVANKI